MNAIQKIGFIGLGIMGKPMAMHLIKAGYGLTVYDIRPEAVKEVVAAGAKDATLSIMVGGKKEVFERVESILKCMGASAVLVGDIGSGNITKLANQIIVALNIAAVSEAMVLATKAGVDPEKVFQAIRGGLAGSTVLRGCNTINLRPLCDGGTIPTPGLPGREGLPPASSLPPRATRFRSLSPLSPLRKCSRLPSTIFSVISPRRRSSHPARRRSQIGSGPIMLQPLNAKVPLALDGNFEPGFRIGLHIKDPANALDTAHEIGFPVPLTSGVMEIMQALKIDGEPGDDHGGIIQFCEDLAKVNVRRRK